VQAPRAAPPEPPAEPAQLTKTESLNYGSTFHNVGKMILHVTNLGFFGTAGQFRYAVVPSCEWPPGSGHNYLYCASLWVGGIRANGDTAVTTGLYWARSLDADFWPDPLSLTDNIYESWEGRPGGVRGIDDDFDGKVDEDPLDGINNDPWSDLRIDEDYGAISQQMYRCGYTDTSAIRNRYVANPDFHHFPLGLKVTQESYQWIGRNWDDFVGVEYRIENMSDETISDVYVGLMVDSDVGDTKKTAAIFFDDLSNFVHQDTVLHFPGRPTEHLSLDIAYMRDAEGGDDESDADGLFGVMFLGHSVDSLGIAAPEKVEIHAYRSWAGFGEDPQHDRERYRYLRGNRWVDGRWDQHIDPAEEKPDDYRMLVSAGPFSKIEPGAELVFQVAFVMLDPLQYDRDDPDEVRTYMLGNAIAAQRIYNRGWRAAAAPPAPNQRLVPGDHRVTIEWDDFSETTPDPLSGEFDFEGYQIWKAGGWKREASAPSDDQWFLIADIHTDELSNYDTGAQGVGKYRYIDANDVKNGFAYWYAVTAYDHGSPRLGLDPQYGTFSQSKALVYPRFNPTSSLENAVDQFEVDPETGEIIGRQTRTNIKSAHVVPNPYKENAAWDEETWPGNATGRKVYFVNLPERATITIYSLGGDYIQTLEHDYHLSPSSDFTYWNLVTHNNQEVVSGVYLYHIASEVGEKTGRFAVIR